MSQAQRRRAPRYWGGDGGYGAPQSYHVSGPPRGPREAYLPPTGSIHPKFHSDREGNHGLLFPDDDTPNEDDYMLYHTFQARGYNPLPEEREEIDAEKKRRAQARRDVVAVEKCRAKADVQRSKFHQQEEDVENARMALLDAKRKNKGDTIGELLVKKHELILRAEQEQCIASEADWLSHELKVEIAMADADMNKAKRYDQRTQARERIERVRAGHAVEAAGKALAADHGY